MRPRRSRKEVHQRQADRPPPRNAAEAIREAAPAAVEAHPQAQQGEPAAPLVEKARSAPGPGVGRKGENPRRVRAGHAAQGGDRLRPSSAEEAAGAPRPQVGDKGRVLEPTAAPARRGPPPVEDPARATRPERDNEATVLKAAEERSGRRSQLSRTRKRSGKASGRKAGDPARRAPRLASAAARAGKGGQGAQHQRPQTEQGARLPIVAPLSGPRS